MGLFTKRIGPVFLKSSNQAKEYVDKLRELKEKCSGELKEEIEKQITIVEYGIKGEECIAFELKNSGMDMYILQDICLQHEDLSAQIDYLIVTRKRIYIIECKNLIGDIEVNSTGDFIRTYQLHGKRIKEGIYSPITQNARHMQVIKEVRKSGKGNIITKTMFENNFANSYKSIVVLANPKTVLNAKYAKKEVKDKIVRADQLVQKIKEMDKQIQDDMTVKAMLEIADFFMDKNQKDRTDYAEKYKKLFERAEASKVQERIKESIKESVASGVDKDVENLEKALKAFRLERSRQEQVKAYFIFNDAQMEDLIKKNPQNKEELCQVAGFGKVKAEKYGDAILEVLRREGK